MNPIQSEEVEFLKNERVFDSDDEIDEVPPDKQEEKEEGSTVGTSEEGSNFVVFESDYDDIDDMLYPLLEPDEFDIKLMDGGDGEIYDWVKPNRISDRYCSHQRKGALVKCPCLGLIRRTRTGPFVVTKEMQADAVLIAQEIDAGDLLCVAGDFRAKYRNHRLVIFALTTNDDNITMEDGSDKSFFMYHMYLLRVAYDCMRDFGKKAKYENYAKGQGPVSIVTGFIKAVIDSVKKVGNTVGQIVEQAFLRVSELVHKVLSYVSETVAEIFNKLLSKMRGFVMRVVLAPLARVADILDENFKTFLVVMIILFLLISIDLARIVTFEVAIPFVKGAYSFLKERLKSDDEECDYFLCTKPFCETCLASEDAGELVRKMRKPKGQADMEPIAAVIGLIGISMGLAKADLAILSKRAREVTNIVSFGVSCSAVLGGLFFCLPTTIHDAIALKFGSKRVKEKMAMEDWLIEASAVISLSKVSSVLASSEMMNWVKDLDLKAKNINIQFVERSLQMRFNAVLAELYRIRAAIVVFRERVTTRSYPFALHLAADPGVGKSLITKRLVKDVFDDTDFYTRPNQDVFWSGYVDEKVIVYDEFMSMSPDFNELCAGEYLSLISTARFQPQFASVNDLNVGIKGTEVRPNGVVTINNNVWFNSNALNKDALNRRRQFAVKAKINPDYSEVFVGNSVDFSKIPSEDISQIKWLRFDLYHPSEAQGKTPFACDLTYLDLIELIRPAYVAHKDTCLLLEQSLTGEVVGDKDPKQMLHDLMAEMRGLPVEKQSVMGAFLSLFSVAAKGQGGQKVDQRPICPYAVVERDAMELEKRVCSLGACYDTKEAMADCKRLMKRARKVKTSDEDMRKRVMSLLNVVNLKLNPPPSSSQDEFLSILDSDERPLEDFEPKKEDPSKIVEKSFFGTDLFRTPKLDRMGVTALKVKVLEFMDEKSWFYVSSFLNNITETARGVCVHSCAMILAGVASIYIALRAILSYTGGKKEGEGEYVCFGQGETHNPKTENKNAKAPQPQLVNYAHAVSPKGNGPLKQCYFSYRGSKNYVIPLKGRAFITMAHGLWLEHEDRYVDVSEELEFVWGDSRAKMKFSDLRLEVDFERDLAIGRLPTYITEISNFPDIVGKFWTDGDASRFRRGEVEIGLGPNARHGNANYHNSMTYQCYDNPNRVLHGCLVYYTDVKEGDCGLVVRSSGVFLPGKYMGMHIAGGSSRSGPYGVAHILTKEILLKMLEGPVFTFDEGMVPRGQSYAGENLLRAEEVSRDEIVFLPKTTSLSKSTISSHLPWGSEKSPAILSSDDPRSGGKDPLNVMINDTLDRNQPEIDEEQLKMVCEDMFRYYEDNLTWPCGKRTLSLQEAINGIPGELCAVNVSTSPGYPLVKLRDKPGKQSFLEWNGEEFEATPCFEQRVFELNSRIERGSMDEGRYLAYLKDELVSQKKIESGRTRLIFCSDMTANCVFRMKYGSFLAAVTKSCRNIPSAMGMNPYSYDMNDIFLKLSEVGNNFVAGDYKNFDKSMVRQFQVAAYALIGRLCRDFVPGLVHENFVRHQMKSPIQARESLLFLDASHLSGCFFTTIINNLVNEMYLRYIFGLSEPHLFFEDHVRLKVLGDDHIFCFSDRVKAKFTPVQIERKLRPLNLIYTSDDKSRELDDSFRSFEDITFLGAHPRNVNGRYCGALRKTTLKEMLCWTKSKDSEILEKARMAMEMASIWGRQFYEEYCNVVNNALERGGFDVIELPSFERVRDTVARRTTGTEENFMNAFGQSSHSIVKLNEKVTTESMSLNNSQGESKLRHKGMNADDADLALSTDSTIFRGSFNWRTADPVGLSIASYAVPFGITKLGDQQNMQNMPINQYRYFYFDHMELKFQINGQPFYGGTLCAYFVPLANYSYGSSNILTGTHVLINADRNTTATLRIPFKYFRNYLNTGAQDTESLGTIYVTPLLQFNSATTNSVTVSIYSSFPGACFKIPRPIAATRGEERMMRVSPDGEIRIMDLPTAYRGQGAGQSTHVTNNFSNVGGTMPIQGLTNSVSPELAQTTEVEASIPLPLDNPPLSSGGLPVVQSFPGMSVSYGVRPTVDLQLYPSAMSRQQMSIFDPCETKISTILGKSTVLTTVRQTTAQVAGTSLYSVILNSRYGLLEGANTPINVAVLNQFMFWRSDLEFTFIAGRSRYHTTRLQAVVVYGSATATAGSRNVSYSTLMDYTDDVSVQSVTIPYNAATEFLRTYEGDGQVDPNQNYSVGVLNVFIANTLQCPSTVAQYVDFAVLLRFVNPKVSVPRAYSPFSWTGLPRIDANNVQITTDTFIGNPVRNPLQPGTVFTTWVTFLRSSFTTSAVLPVGDHLASGSISARYYDGTSMVGTWWQHAVNRVTVSLTEYTFTFVNPVQMTVAPGDWNLFQIGIFIPVWVNPSLNPNREVMDDSIEKSSSILMQTLLTKKREEKQKQTKKETEAPKNARGQSGGVLPVQDGEVESVAVTTEDTPPRPNIPCRLEIGEKFEMCVADVHEVGRRYSRYAPRPAFRRDLMVTSVNGFQHYTTLRTSPFGPWTNLFAAWAGAIKYRIYGNTRGSANIVFMPTFNAPGTDGVPGFDVLAGGVFLHPGGSVSSSTSTWGGQPPREKYYPLTTDVNFIDVSVPAQMHQTFFATTSDDPKIPESSGTLAVEKAENLEPDIFVAYGDDLRLGIFRCPRSVNFYMAGFNNGFCGFH